MRSNGGRTKPELALAGALWRRGLRFLTPQGYVARYGSGLPGRPDLVFPGPRVFVFFQGCWWHGCPVCRRVKPDTRPEWWVKIERNVTHDKRVRAELASAGWRAIDVWEHETASRKRLEATADRLAEELREASERARRDKRARKATAAALP